MIKSACPRESRAQVLCTLPDDPLAGHLGVSKKKCVGSFIGNACGRMLRIKLGGAVHVLKVTIRPKQLKAPLINIKAGHPLRRVTKEIESRTPRATSGHEWSLLMSDHFTKFAQAFPLRNSSALTLAKKVMDDYICRFAYFEGLHSNQGANKDGAAFRGLCDLIIVAKTMATPYYPHGMDRWRD